MSTHLTPFDTGEILEPEFHFDNRGVKTGKVDFDNDESATILTLSAYPSKAGGYLTVLDIDANDDVKIIVNGRVVAVVSAVGNPV